MERHVGHAALLFGNILEKLRMDECCVKFGGPGVSSGTLTQRLPAAQGMVYAAEVVCGLYVCVAQIILATV